ncbi:MAG: Crp/Fnr family transcriptional regulator [Pseudorhodoplanes sp.]
MTTRLPPCVGCIGGAVSFEACTGRGEACGPLHCHGRLIAKDAYVFHQNDSATHVHWVRRGLLRLYKTLANGKRQIVGFAFPGEFVDLAAEGDYRISAQAVVETELRSMPRAGFKSAAQADAEFSYQLFVSVAGLLERASDLALTVGQRTAEASLAAFLIEMHERTAMGDPARRDLFLPMPRSDIADYLGLTPETISRLFTRFSQQGLIATCKRRGVNLLSLEALQRLAQGLPDGHRS